MCVASAPLFGVSIKVRGILDGMIGLGDLVLGWGLWEDIA